MLILGDFEVESVSVAKSNKFLLIVFNFADYFGFLHSFQEEFGLYAFSDIF